MSLSDPIADFLTRIRNAKDAKRRYLDVHFSKIKENLAKVLKEKHLIDNYLVNVEQRKIRVFLRYSKGRDSVIQGLKRVSKPGCRKYVGCDDIPRVLGGIGCAILSTPKGILDGETAKRERVGGELLCLVW